MTARSRVWRLSAPTDGQLGALARYGVDPPENATRGEISDMLDHLAENASPSSHPRDFDRCDACGARYEYCDCDNGHDHDADDYDGDGAYEFPEGSGG